MEADLPKGKDDLPKSESAIENDLVKHLAETTDLSPNQALELIQRHGADRAKLEEIARTMKAES